MVWIKGLSVMNTAIEDEPFYSSGPPATVNRNNGNPSFEPSPITTLIQPHSNPRQPPQLEAVDHAWSLSLSLSLSTPPNTTPIPIQIRDSHHSSRQSTMKSSAADSEGFLKVVLALLAPHFKSPSMRRANPVPPPSAIASGWASCGGLGGGVGMVRVGVESGDVNGGGCSDRDGNESGAVQQRCTGFHTHSPCTSLSSTGRHDD